MRRLGLRIACAGAFAAAALLASAVSASAATSTIPFTTCADAPAFGCSHLVVPIDPTGAVPGTITLTIRRRLAPSAGATEAVIALAGGPGQAALPFGNTAAQVMSSALTTRDLVVFDQRGTGDSGGLKCSAFANASAPLSVSIPGCAAEIGSDRGFYTTDDSVYDIEQIRKALGYTKLVIYGTSYGTKVAERYAAEYPQNTAALVLDSVVTPNGPDVFDQSTYQAVPRILGQLCASGACPGIPDPLGDLTKVLTHLANHPVKAAFYDGNGQRKMVSIRPGALANILISGDTDPVLRADFPAAVHAAAAGNYGLLAILTDHTNADGTIESGAVDDPLFYDTECEELPFPWNRADSPAQRASEALAAAEALPAGSFGPFSAKTAYAESSAPACAYWPFGSAAPETTVTSLPNIPTLIISGMDDLRTPEANALAVHAMIPDSTVVFVPQTGHSVLTTEPSQCAQNAVTAFFEGNPIQTTCPVKALPDYLSPAHALPASLTGIAPVGAGGGPGHTAGAVELTLDWTARELDESLFESLIGNYNPSFNHGLGGLHGGFVKVTTSKSTQRITIDFHSFSYIGGIRVSGTFVEGIGRLRISGSQAASGTLVSKRPNVFSGTLGGVHVHFAISNANTTALEASPAHLLG
jgi:pimeloyl-ACP methyl ester carboxylesterase